MSKIWIVLLVILAITSLGCIGFDKTEGTIKTGEGEIEYSVPEGSENEWCAVGSSIKMSDGSTGGMTWEVVGKEVIDGIEMCKMEMKTTFEDEENFRMVMLYSKDDSIVITKTYDSSDNLIKEMTVNEGDDTIIITYDSSGNLVKEMTVNEDGVTITITYDSSGNVINKMTMSEDGISMEDGEGNIIS